MCTLHTYTKYDLRQIGYGNFSEKVGLIHRSEVRQVASPAKYSWEDVLLSGGWTPHNPCH